MDEKDLERRRSAAPIKAGHTPGPWAFTEDGEIYSVSLYRSVAMVLMVDGIDNRPLLAAAPDLLAAVRAFIDRFYSGRGLRADTDLVAGLMLAAFTKATAGPEATEEQAERSEDAPTPTGDS